MNKLGMSSVVAVALLLVIAVISVVGFQSWFNTFSTSTLSGVESQGSGDVIATGAKTVVGGQLYFNNGYNGALEVSRVTIGGNDCNFSGSLSNGLSNLSLSNNCTQNLSSSVSEVVVYTDKGIFSSKMKVGSVSSSSSSPSLASCLRNGTTVTSGSSSTFYSAFSVDYGSSCSGLLRNCTDGVFDGSDLFNYSSCSVGVQYLINHSLRFNDDDSAYLSWTPTTAGNRKVWTWSGWVKRTSESTQILFATGVVNAGNDEQVYFEDNSLKILIRAGGNRGITTGTIFGSSSDWSHLVISTNVTQTLDSDRIKIYFNGILQSTSSIFSGYPIDSDTFFNSVVAHYLGRRDGGVWGDGNYDGYLSDVYFIDGQALNASYFGINASGEWIPKEYTGSYGTNGFYLNFNDSSSLGDDKSGNANDWTVNNLDSTDWMFDNPTNNFFTLEASMTADEPMVFSEGNLKAYSSDSSGYHKFKSSDSMTTGSWYWEIILTDAYTSTTDWIIGVANDSFNWADQGYNMAYSSTWGLNGAEDSRHESSSVSYGAGSLAVGDIIMYAYNSSSEKIWFGKNGVWYNSGDPASDSNEIFSSVTSGVYIGGHPGAAGGVMVNFGQGGQSGLTYYSDAGGYFKCEPPTGFKALSSRNIN